MATIPTPPKTGDLRMDEFLNYVYVKMDQLGSGVSVAPNNASYITQVPSDFLSDEQALSDLTTGILKSTTGTGVISIAAAGTDYAAASHVHSATDDITSGTLAVARGGTGTGTAFTAGSLVFAGASGVYSQDNSNIFWNNSTKCFGLGTSSPQALFHVSAAGQPIMMWSSTGGGSGTKNGRIIYDGGGAVTGGGWVFQAFSDAFGFTANTVIITQNLGRIGLSGNLAPAVIIDASLAVDAIHLPTGTTGQRPTGANGMIRYNTTTSKVEAYAGGAWTALH